MIYRVHYWHEIECHQGYDYFGSLKEAQKAKKTFEKNDQCNADITNEVTPKTKEKIIQLLNKWASHNDNG